MTILIPAPSIEIALAVFTEWEEKRVKRDLPEGTVRMTATGDPDLPWVIEVLEELFEEEELE